MQRSITFAVLAAVLAVSIVGASNAYAWKTEYDDNGRRFLNGHQVPGSDPPIKAYVYTEVFTCTWFRADDDSRCQDFSWIPQEIVDWLRHTNSYHDGNLYIMNEWDR